MKRLQYKSDAQVEKHIEHSDPRKAESLAHEKRESKGFERAEHRLYSKTRKMSKH
jgi:hypothetical protein